MSLDFAFTGLCPSGATAYVNTELVIVSQVTHFTIL